VTSVSTSWQLRHFRVGLDASGILRRRAVRVRHRPHECERSFNWQFDRQMGSDHNDATFRSERVLPHPVQRVFEAFARPELLARWWGPAGFSNTFETFEFEPGGRWKFVMHGPGRSHHANESIFLEILAPSRLVIQHVSPPHFVLTVTLAAHEAGSLITWNQEFEDRALAARLRQIAEPANEQNLDRLQSVLGGAQP
jgi:uncharacterized protein YndB with AHSA1/START domain